MYEISTQKILDGITRALRAEWSESLIYDDVVEHGLRSGAFNVILVSSDQRQFVGERYKREPRFDVLYYPKKGREECYAVADRLSMILRFVQIANNEQIRGTDVSFRVEDGVLHFFISYKYIIRNITGRESPMESIEIK